MTNGPLDHIARPLLPWRTDGLTECGRPIGDVRSVKSREEIEAKIRRDGQQRAAYTTCMTCVSTSGRWTHGTISTWDADPITVMEREINSRRYGSGEDRDQFVRELLAIGKLVEKHRDEFDALTQGMADTVDLAARRAQRNQPKSTGGL